MDLNTLLTAVREGRVSVEQAAESISAVCCAAAGAGAAEEDNGPKVINCAGIKPDEFRELFFELASLGNDILAIRATTAHWRSISQNSRKARYNQMAGAIILRQTAPEERGLVYIVTSSRSGMGVAQEALETCQIFGTCTECIYNVNISGISRLQATERIFSSSCIIAVTGAEGVLPAMLAGLTRKPVISVPTDYNTGSWIQGASALLSSVEGQTPGITTVGINNGFSAGYFASLVNNEVECSREAALSSFFRSPKSGS